LCFLSSHINPIPQILIHDAVEADTSRTAKRLSYHLLGAQAKKESKAECIDGGASQQIQKMQKGFGGTLNQPEITNQA